MEREHITKAVEIHTKATGSRPLGWYQGRCSPNTRRLIAEEGGFIDNADSYADDLPCWDTSTGMPQLIVPYAFDSNDMRFATPQGFNSGDQFFAYLKDSFENAVRTAALRTWKIRKWPMLKPRNSVIGQTMNEKINELT